MKRPIRFRGNTFLDVMVPAFSSVKGCYGHNMLIGDYMPVHVREMSFGFVTYQVPRHGQGN